MADDKTRMDQKISGPKFLVEERVRRFEKSVRKKRRRLPRNATNSLQTQHLQATERAILDLPNGFNSHPMSFLEQVVFIKYRSRIKPFKAIKKFHVYHDTHHQSPKDNKVAAQVYKCIEQDDVDNLLTFLTKGFDVNYHNRHGETVLHYACKHVAIGCVHELIQHQANVGISCSLGRTPLHNAMWFHKEVSMELVRLLCGREPTMLLAADEHNDTPLDAINPIQWPAICDFLNLYVDHYYRKLTPFLPAVSDGITVVPAEARALPGNYTTIPQKVLTHMKEQRARKQFASPLEDRESSRPQQFGARPMFSVARGQMNRAAQMRQAAAPASSSSPDVPHVPHTNKTPQAVYRALARSRYEEREAEARPGAYGYSVPV